MNDVVNNAEFSRKSSLAYVIGLAIAAPIVFLLLPVVIGALYSELGLTESQLGLFATVELFGIAIAAASGLYWTSRWNWRTVIRAALVAMLVGNIVTYAALAHASFTQLLWLRFAVGLASGGMMAIVLTYIANHPDTERAAGFLVATQVTVQIVGVFLLPLVIASTALGSIFLGAKGIFLIFAIVAAILVTATKLLPTGTSAEESEIEQGAFEHGKRSPAIIVLISLALFFVTQAAIWGFLELFGADAGMNSSDTTLVITLSLVFSIAGALFAGVFGNKFGQAKPIIVAGALQLGALVIVGVFKIDFTVFLISMVLFQIGWNMALPYQYGVIADIDRSHRFIVLTSPAQAIGIALGPVFGGVFIERFGYIALFIASGVVLLLYLGCILPFAKIRPD